MESNLYGKVCKVYSVPSSIISTNQPSFTVLVDTVIPNSEYVFDFNFAFPVVQNSSSALGSSFYLYDPPTLPGLPSTFNAENGLKLDSWTPNWQQMSLFYSVSPNYTGTVNTAECVSLFPNKKDITSFVMDASCRALLLMFENKFAMYFPCQNSDDWMAQGISLYDLIAGQWDSNFVFPFIQFRNGSRCATGMIVKTQQSASSNAVYKYTTARGSYSQMTDSVYYGGGSGGSVDADFVRYLEDDFVPPEPSDVDPYDPGGTSGPGGGTGTFSDTGDIVGVPSLPTLSAVDTGFVTLFNPSPAQVKQLCTYMWSQNFDLSLFKNVVANPMDCILGLTIVPVNPPNAGTKAVTVGNIATDVVLPYLSSQYVAVDCGTLNVQEFWGSYLDYSPYTKMSLYLPYIGIVPLDIDDVMNASISITYHVDVLSGACVAYVLCNGTQLYTYIGQCSSNVPVTSNDFTNTVNGILGIAGNIGSLVMSGGASAPSDVAGIASNAINALKPNVQKSGAMSGTGGLMGVQTPYLICQRPRQSLPESQNSFAGYPSNITSRLSDLSGYTEVDKIHLEGVPCTNEEMEEIMQLLESGVYI